MDKVLNLYKKQGETPLECIHRFKMLNPEYAQIPMTYAGRLDPLAEGVLVVLADEKVHTKNDFLALPKEYEVDVLFGISTDTYDVLGLVGESSVAPCDISLAEEKLESLTGRRVVPYPPYSSKPVGGKPLFMWARTGEIDSLSVPTREVDIYSIRCEGWKEVSSDGVLANVEKLIQSVDGDFRQEVCLAEWKKVLREMKYTFFVAHIVVSCSSGAYMRSLAYEWGKTMDLPSLAYRIVRTKVGEFEIGDSLR